MEEDATDHFDEQIWLLSGTSERDVYDQAMTHGRKEDEIFHNINGRKMHWKFLGIAEITPLIPDEISLVFSRTIETDKNSLFEKSIFQRSQKLSEIYQHPIKIREFDH